jgi:hypothetical protein
MKKLTSEEYKALSQLVLNYKTKHKEGFVDDEQEELLKNFSDINMDRYYDVLNGVTCIIDQKTQEFIIYHCDILTAILCGLEDRDMYTSEWD